LRIDQLLGLAQSCPAKSANQRRIAIPKASFTKQKNTYFERVLYGDYTSHAINREQHRSCGTYTITMNIASHEKYHIHCSLIARIAQHQCANICTALRAW